MIPQEVKTLIKDLIKEAISEHSNETKAKLDSLNHRVNQLETDLLIQKEGDNF